MKLLFAVGALALCAEVGAQELFKCKDAAGRITYSGSTCKDLGLSSAGEVKGQANVMSVPPLKPMAPSAPREERPTVPKAEAPETPERRCFTVKTAKGTATRCNDSPAEESN